MMFEDITMKQILSFFAGISTISIVFIKVYNWYKGNENKIKDLENRIIALEKDSITNKKENMILLKGQLACLKGLSEQGCDGPVSDSIKEIEEYLLETSHK